MENDMEAVQWCNICSKMVHPMTNAENKCPFCETEFCEVMDNLRDQNDVIDLRSAWVFSLYAPIFLGLLSAFSPSVASIFSQGSSSSRGEEEVEQERDNELVLGGRRSTSTYMMQLFRGLHVRMVSEFENLEDTRNMDSSSILVLDPFNEGALIVRGPNLNHTTSPNENVVSPFNDIVVGSGFDLLLQHLAQIGPGGYTSVNPPAQKAAIEAMPCVTSEEKLQCTVCLEDVDIGSEATEMPCKHKFHGDCIISWLKLHGSCPVCRFQMPSDDSTVEANVRIGNRDNQNSELVRAGEERTRNGRRTWFPMLQSFNNFLPSP
ncbi:E3 ubiquitin-protein ligase SIRP1-like [Abrus precatorius]|uniref:RING-type E3 ubiquitin transferase n=1 Tax=Abrus precatorius TaxID=3816 RepID=A0A8B8LMR4_ABRPR|nr:E3 ubiquitin-protein ligase SIRP1-like [Abrus precatorius]